MNRILLLMANRHDQDLLRSTLESRFEILAGESSGLLEQEFDLCILDGPMLQAFAERILTLRKTSSVFLPFLLLTSRKELRLAASQLWTVIDEMLITPIEPAELLARVTILLRNREQSLELERSRSELYRGLIEQSLIGVYLIEGGRFMFLNEAAAGIFGAAPEAIRGTDPLTWVDPLERSKVTQLRGTLRAKPIQYTFRALRNDGSGLVCEAFERLVHQEGHSLILGGLIDTTAITRLESALSESEKRFESAFDFAAIGMALIAPDGRWLRINRALRQMLGFSENELLERTFLDVTFPEDQARTQALFQRLLEGKKPPYQFEGRYARRDGQILWGLVSLSLVRGDSDRPLYAIAQIQDVTARKKAEEEREKAREQRIEALQQMDQVKDEFLSVVSHELRTPLNAVMGFGSFLEDEVGGPLNAKQHEYVDKILKGADQMLVLIDDLLDFARMQAGRFGITVVETDYPTLVAETVEAFVPRGEAKKIRIESRVEVPQPVCLDRRRIQQVLSNLLSNAIKFTPEEGWVKVRAYLENGQLVTAVSDNGIGISPEDLPKLFHAFKQLDMGLTRRSGGVGLGLSISKAIVEAHGGTMEAESEVEKGSTFIFRIPVNGTAS